MHTENKVFAKTSIKHASFPENHTLMHSVLLSLQLYKVMFNQYSTSGSSVAKTCGVFLRFFIVSFAIFRV